MGQRHQYIVIYPKMYLNKGNPNNKPERAEVIHHQRLYGRSAILSLDRVLRLIANAWDGKFSDHLFGRSDNGYAGGEGTSAIAAAISVDPDEGYFHNVHQWNDQDWNGMKNYYCKPQNLEPDMFDNNDGITVIKFEVGQLKPKICFITPNHLEGSHWSDSDGQGPWTPGEYLEFYYSKKEQSEWDKELQDRMRNSLDRIKSLSRPMSLSEVKKLLPKFKLSKSQSKRGA